ncbi:hypothetical protein HTZ84_09465 [Haloterrigena sp. SYSU A558-1]|uniref:Concanavalin A-like lectin/glucanase superfamily protein n=1 Tax=Haloterrigena gelatinilytica TaxID=2741724 RepID=A0ABX2LCB9_9EURY|nr:hypothetical protein [Haloterrigena gelatinilytica]NUC72533.1 hypothetical protein [Haloterrigena gelatinilytica]
MAYETLLKDWGNSGVEWKDGWAFSKDEPLPAEWGNFLMDNLITDVQHLIDLTNAIDPNNDGQVDDAYTLRGKTPDELGGFKYVQTETPNDAGRGASWYKDSNGLMLVHDGTQFGAQPEVGYDETDTLDTDGFSVTHETPTRTKLVDGSILLINEQVVADFENGNIDPEHGAWSWTAGTGHLSVQSSQVISGTQSLEMESAGTDAISTLTRDLPIVQDWEFAIQIGSDTSNINDRSRFSAYDETGNRLAAITFNDGAGNVVLTHGNGDTEISGGWAADRTYSFEFDWDFPNNEFDLYMDGVLEGTFATEAIASNFKEFEIENNTLNSGATRSVFADDFHSGAREYGEAVITCPEPDERIISWDVLRFTRTLAGESVVVDVEDEDGTVLVSDISSNDDLSVVDAATNPRIRVRLSRTDTANHPSFDSLYRRWTMRPGDTGKSPAEWEGVYNDLLERSGDSMIGPLTLGEDLYATDGETIWDETASHIPQERIEQGSGSGLDSDTLDGDELELIERRNRKNRFIHGLLINRNN